MSDSRNVTFASLPSRTQKTLMRRLQEQGETVTTPGERDYLDALVSVHSQATGDPEKLGGREVGAVVDELVNMKGYLKGNVVRWTGKFRRPDADSPSARLGYEIQWVGREATTQHPRPVLPQSHWQQGPLTYWTTSND